jgi:hypothetical protein
MPPSYVAPYVKRGKTDAADAAVWRGDLDRKGAAIRMGIRCRGIGMIVVA